ncbi:cytochrome P450 [Athelia psychrophila]|uniref:Cytochrome P450 n=1 Tax=Athelia psychrophila TaxID=1759441 RepID=A0A166UV01_9AGAM|nr:cytochrome P450 [Fibularhizoctonia sp. CBS 109695]
MASFTPIPQPPAIPFLGNVTTIDKDLPIRSFELLAEKYGELYQLNMLGHRVLFANSYALQNELSDEKRFKKKIGASLNEVRNLTGDGLFTARNEEPNWALAHKLLMPAFGPAAIRDMFGGMQDVADQMILKWERFGADTLIDPTDDFTRLALDTLALCTTSYRLNSFYSESHPPFGTAMGDFLKECFLRTSRPSIVQALMPGTTAKYVDDIRYMNGVASKIVAERKAHPVGKREGGSSDSLDAMLDGRDKDGNGLSDEAIINNLLVFLIAGHETSSATLCFIVYYTLKDPAVMRKLRDEVDSVCGDERIRAEHLAKLSYLTAIMRETLRLQPPAVARAVYSEVDTTISGANGETYPVKAHQVVAVQNWCAMKDPKVWGEDAQAFRPERMLDGKFEALPPNAWQPFGFGMRACIGRPFAWQEILLAIASITQKFDLTMEDPGYTLELKQSLTIKPKDFRIRAAPRSRTNRISATPSSPRTLRGSGARAFALPTKPVEGATPLYVLYGSNTGTSESFAQRIVNDATTYGFQPHLGTLDSATDHLPTDGPVVIVTASFEGEPADNAAKFVDWLQHLEGTELAGVRYAVFGCGNRDWVQTFQRVPKLCDTLLSERGGSRLLERGVGDASAPDFFESFDAFEEKLWAALSKEFQTTKNESAGSGFEIKTIDVGTARAAALRQPDAALGRVVENRLLTKAGAPVKRHIEFELPEDASARAGDYLAILPHNPPRDVQRALAHFGLSNEQQVVVSSTSPTSLPVDKPVSLAEVLSGYVELSQPATTRDLRTMIDAASPTTREALDGLVAAYAEKVLAPRLSVLDILEQHADIALSLGAFLQMLPAMRVRQYSISSSPLWNPQHVTLTISVVEGPALSGRADEFLGVGSNFLAHLRAGDRVQVAVRPSNAAFHPPSDPMTPVVMFCAGSGFAPMRGFIQERAAQKAAGREVATALLFFGCRAPDEDFLYADSDLAEWIALGVVDVRPAFSRRAEASAGCKYVQDRVWQDRVEVHAAYERNAKFFSCGSGKVAAGVREALIRIIIEKHPSDSAEEATAKFERITKGRYATDIFD